MPNAEGAYQRLKDWKEKRLAEGFTDISSLNRFHDSVMRRVFAVAAARLGNPPCDFCWFITGSGGRGEQGYVSDQDHGLIYEPGDGEIDKYFSRLGKELADGLHALGYPYCPGKVMSSNPLWCKSFPDWQKQMKEWLEEGSWEAVRYLQIFFDARGLNGRGEWILALKDFIFEHQRKNPGLLIRMTEQSLNVKRAFGPVGQVLVEEKGKYHGMINWKYSAYLPYVNAVRILAVKEGIYETSTCGRIDQLSANGGYGEIMKEKKELFQSLLQHRLSIKTFSYEESHYLPWETLKDDEKKEMKKMLKEGAKLLKAVRKRVERDVKHGL
ncbi:MAG: DUF294 nucleotidyltransferase-like domain-containing protein [Bacillaceae bacterium]|nr:hypothetical protein [Bacillaceae bacterium]